MPVSTEAGANLGQANTSHNIIADSEGRIFVGYGTSSGGVKVAASTNRGASFLPGVQVGTQNSVQHVDITVTESDKLYVVWMSGSTIFLSFSTDHGVTWSAPNTVGGPGGNGVHVVATASNVYVRPDGSTALFYSNTAGGVGAFTSTSTYTPAYSHPFVDPTNGYVFDLTDDPTLRLFRSTNNGASFTPFSLSNASAAIYYSDVTASLSPQGKFAFMAGDNTGNGTAFRINLVTSNVDTLAFGPNTGNSQGRSLAADNLGNLVDNYNEGGVIKYKASQNLGNSFASAVTVATASTSNAVINRSSGDVLIAYQTGAGIFLNVNAGELAVSGLSINNVTLAEGTTGTTSFDFTVTRSGDTTVTATVHYSTSNGTATAGSDYTAIGDTELTFAPGETTKTISVLVNGDTTSEPNETFNVNLSNATGAAINSATGIGTIVNGGTVINISGAVLANEGNSGTSNFDFTVTRSGITTGISTVHYSTSNGTATAGSDYVAIPDTTLTFEAGETTKTISVVVNGDATIEPDENFNVNLSLPTGAIIGNATGIGTIINDEPILSVTGVSILEGNSGTTSFDFTVTRTGDPSGTSTVHYSTNNGTATSASDYTAVPDTLLTFEAGETTKTISVLVNGDTTYEGNETFSITLSNATGATLNRSAAIGTILDDDNTAPTFDAIADQRVAEPAPSATLSSVRFEWLATCGSETVTFSLNGAGVTTNSNPAGTGSCTCSPPLSTFTTTDSALLAAYSRGGDNVLRAVKTASGGTNFLWARAVLFTTDSRQVTRKIFDYSGGNADNMNLCAANSTNAFNLSSTYTGPSLFSSGYNLSITGVSPGLAAESAQTVTLTATSSNPTLIPTPTMSGTGATRTLNYNPAAGLSGVATIAVVADDGLSFNSLFMRTFKITVNVAPVANNQSVITTEDTPIATTLSASDANTNAVLTYPIISGPTNGTLSGNAPNLTYTPNSNFSGTDSFTWKADDGIDSSATVTFSITVNSTNDTPQVDAGSDGSISPPQTFTRAGSFTDPDADTWTGTVDYGDGSGVQPLTLTNKTFNLSHNYAATGTYTVTVSINDSANATGTDTFTLSVNTAPTANNGTATTDEETVVAITLGATDADAGDTLSYIITQLPAHGTLTNSDNSAIVNNTPTSKVVKYTPELNYPLGAPPATGPDSFKFKANDGTEDSNEATVSITVNAICDFPLAVGDAYSAGENTTLNVSAPGVLGNDSEFDGETLHAIKVTNPAHGTLTLNDNGSFVYVPAFNYIGADSFTYKASDGGLDGNTVTVNISVTAGPAIGSFTPTSGAPGTTVTVNGSGYIPASIVKLNGATVGAGDMVSITATKIIFKIPASGTTGRISISNASGEHFSTGTLTVMPRSLTFTPSSGAVGTIVTISGTNLGSPNSTVKIGGVNAPLQSFSVGELRVSVPVTAVSGLITVTNSGGTATSATPFTVLPKVTSFSPVGGAEGASVIINGSGFTGATDVQFNGMTANFTVNSNIKITATVPVGATRGLVTVTTPVDTATSPNPFTVAPIVTSVVPTSGKKQSRVTITGRNLELATVKIGTVAQVIAAADRTATSLTFTVPNTTVTGAITVTNAGGTINAGTFTVLP